MKILWLFCAILTLNGCSQIKLNNYEKNTPVFKVREFFDGELLAHGVVKNRSGKVIRSFTATIKASWVGETGTLDETFNFSDGEIQKRIWTLKKINDLTYSAKANDTVGSSTLQTAGNALFMKYTLTIDYKGSPLNIRVDDRMYLVDTNRLINESVMSKFGFTVGRVMLSIQKLDKN